MKKILIFTLILPLAACYKAPAIDSNIRLEVTERGASNEAWTHPEDLLVYLYNCDTTNYKPRSFEEAAEGKITDLRNNTTIEKDATAERQDTLYYFKGLKRSPVTIVICDLENRFYGYKENSLAGGIDTMFLSLPIELDKLMPGVVWKKNEWRIIKAEEEETEE